MALDAFERRHEQLEVDPNLNCQATARALADKLWLEGKQAEIYEIESRFHDTSGNAQDLKPAIHRDVSWSRHVVCVAIETDRRIVYDPLLPEPLEQGTYLQTMFNGQPVIVTERTDKYIDMPPDQWMHL